VDDPNQVTIDEVAATAEEDGPPMPSDDDLPF